MLDDFIIVSIRLIYLLSWIFKFLVSICFVMNFVMIDELNFNNHLFFIGNRLLFVRCFINCLLMIMLFIITFISLFLSFVSCARILIVFINISLFSLLIFMKVSFVINLRQYELAIVIFQGYLIDQVIADIEWLIMRLLLNFSLILKFNHLLT